MTMHAERGAIKKKRAKTAHSEKCEQTALCQKSKNLTANFPSWSHHLTLETVRVWITTDNSCWRTHPSRTQWLDLCRIPVCSWPHRWRLCWCCRPPSARRDDFPAPVQFQASGRTNWGTTTTELTSNSANGNLVLWWLISFFYHLKL